MATVRSSTSGEHIDIKGIDYDNTNGDLLMRLRSAEQAKRAWRKAALKFAALVLRKKKSEFIAIFSDAFEVAAVELMRTANDMNNEKMSSIPMFADDLDDDDIDDATVVESQESFGYELGPPCRLVRDEE